MSELKAFDIVVAEEGYCEGIVKYRRAVYDKSEADAAIDKLKSAAVKELRYQKYKRCLNKAEWCEERCARYDLLQEHSGFDWSKEIDFYFRWQQRWLELAEKFKKAK